MTYDDEAWRPVPGFEGLYEVSDCGRVRNVAMGRGRVPGRILRPVATPSGHITVDLSIGGKKRPWPIHRLVMMGFVGPCPEGMECCHNDSNPTNNALSNLRWDTRSGNERDKVANGTTNRGSRHGMSKLTEDTVRSIRSSRLTSLELAAWHGVSRSTVENIRSGRSWRHVL